MKSFVMVFTSSAIFGAIIWVIYWFVARQEAAGAILLGVMTAALSFATLYAVVAEREARLEGDAKDAPPDAFAGDDLGIYTKQSAWPILLCLCVGLGLLGLLWSPLFACVMLAGFILCLWRLGAESARRHEDGRVE